MKQLAENLWVTEAPQRFLGIELGARMTVVRLPNSALILHSPIAATDTLIAEVGALGTVAHIIAPNCFHHLHVGSWKNAFPEASIRIAPGLNKKRPDLTADTLKDEAESAWSGTLEQLQLRGLPALNEIVFFHTESRTLIATDIAFNIGPDSPALTRAAFRIAGTYNKLSPTFLERILVRNKPEFRNSLEHVLGWPFERVIVSHGSVSESGGRAELERGYHWVLGGPRTAALPE